MRGWEIRRDLEDGEEDQVGRCRAQLGRVCPDGVDAAGLGPGEVGVRVTEGACVGPESVLVSV